MASELQIRENEVTTNQRLLRRFPCRAVVPRQPLGIPRGCHDVAALQAQMVGGFIPSPPCR